MRKGFTLPLSAVRFRAANIFLSKSVHWHSKACLSAFILSGIGTLWSPVGTLLLIAGVFVSFRLFARHWQLDVLIGGCLGLVLVTTHVYSASAGRIPEPKTLVAQPVEVERCWPNQWGSRCLLRLPTGERWYLNWPRDEPVFIGMRAEVDVRLTPWAVPTNPGVSPFSVWLLRYDITAQGRVDQVVALPSRLGVETLEGARSQLRERALPDFYQGVYQALVLGDRARLDPDMRNRVERTQTQHLLALSGLHIGTLALAAYGLAGVLWLLCPLGIRQDWQYLAALLAAGLLLVIALPGVSLWRAFLMLLVPTVAWVCRVRLGATEALLVIGTAMLIADPRLVLDLGAWFSWLATVLLVIIALHSQRRPWYITAIWLQTVLSLLLIPLYALWELPVFPLSIPLNVLLIPLVTFWVLPSAFLTAMHIPFADTLFMLGVDLWYYLLVQFDRLWVWFPVLSVLQALLLLVSSLLLIIVRLPKSAWCAWLLLLFGVSWHNSQPAPLAEGEFDVWVLDVGQAQAVVIDTGGGRVMFDTGNGDPARVNLYHAALRWHWWSPHRPWAAVIISHLDRDHAGGLTSVAAGLRPQRFYSGQSMMTPGHWPTTEFCNHGVEFSVNAVQFRFLRPYVGFLPQDNNDASCILLVESEHGRVLLTGDASKRVEYGILQSAPPGKIDLLVSGHHGSATSTSAELLRLTQPTWVVHSAARYSRHAIPAPDVLQRVEDSGAINHCTCASGSRIYRFRHAGIVTERYGHRLLPWIRI
ncbi:DNA internalization-related competence protein ComEC/Rec2 [Salinispirillum sp. LH 10-3-1]|uniref:DNA internalization-related competence protein ComEC/Rec2 n=1 Tax=Salinispirillum sp. LH 10-3-1 TaxID=2952525 RepID=A0AB38YBE0_9GAMM